jgi:uncharacterized protein (TIGR02145 family)
MIKANLILILFVCLGTISFSQTVTIGTQVWMTKNLDVSTFRNGDPIPEAKTTEEWENAGKNKQPAWCYYDNDPKNGEKYGKLYNWYAVSDPRGLAPAGYHIPNDAEWTTLKNYIGNDNGNKMKSTSSWADNGNGTNSSGFSGLPGGYRYFNCTFYDFGGYGGWWSSTENGANSAWCRSLHCFDGDVGRYGNSKTVGFSVRCLRDYN